MGNTLVVSCRPLAISTRLENKVGSVLYLYYTTLISRGRLDQINISCPFWALVDPKYYSIVACVY